MNGRHRRGHAGKRVALAAACAVLGPLSLSAVPAQAADLHELTPQGCVNLIGPPTCAETADGLDGPQDVTVSPDGRDVYITTINHNAIVHLQRSTATGALTPSSCIGDAGTLTCPTTTEGLNGATKLVISPDGRDVYVTGINDHTLVHLDRDTTTGLLTPVTCISDFSQVGKCPVSAEGLEGAAGLAMSPAGDSLYVRSRDDQALARFDRDATTGALTPQGCFESPGNAVGCAAVAPGIGGTGTVIVSPDGGDVYTTGLGVNAVAHLERAPGGALASVGCVADVGDIPGCGVTADGLTAALGLTASPDGTSVYVAGLTADAVARFTRDSGTGVLTSAGCVRDIGAPTVCAQEAQGLDGAYAPTVSPDGASLYVASLNDSAVVTFGRAGSGALTNQRCVSDSAVAAGCDSQTPGLHTASSVVVSPTGSSVYAVGFVSDAIARFDRELAPVCGPSAASTTAPDPVVVTLECSDPNGDPIALTVVDAPTGGTLVGAPNPVTREITYTPDAAFAGVDSFTYRATSDGKDSNVGTATLTVAPAAPPPDPPPGDPPPGDPPPGDPPPPAPSGETSPSPAPGPRPDSGTEPGPPPPVTGATVNLLPTQGTVLVRVPGSSEFVRVTDPTSVPTGTIVDATKGVVALRGRAPDGTIETMRFFAGTFRVTQPSAAGRVVDARLIGGDLAGCPTTSPGYRAWADEQRRFFGRRVPRALTSSDATALATAPGFAAAAKKKKPAAKRRGGRTRRLWGDGTGRFRTTGREAAATVRGTRWLTEDTCTTTRVTVRAGVVEVRDRATGATLLVRRGQTVSAPFTVATLRRIASGGSRVGRMTAKARAKVRAASPR